MQFNKLLYKFSPKTNTRLAIGGVIVLLIGSAYLFHLKNKKPSIEPTLVEVAKVRIGPLDKTIPGIGILKANESIILKPEVTGRIEKILFKEGQYVEKGTPLFLLEDTIAKANVKEATADRDLRQADYTRAQILTEKGALSLTEKENAYAKLQASEAVLAKAESTLNKMTIHAPFEGWLGLRKVNVGDYVSPGQELVNLVDLDPIKLECQIAEIYLEKLKIDQLIDLTTDAFAQQNFIGQIYAIDPQIDPIGHSILIRALVQNANNILKPGLFVKFNILLDHIDEALFIPNQSLISKDNKQFVYKIIHNEAVLTEVTLGDRYHNEVEIIEGLMPYDVVITAGHLKIKPHMKVKALFRETT